MSTTSRVGYDRLGPHIHLVTDAPREEGDNLHFDPIAQCSRREATVTGRVPDDRLLDHVTCERCRTMIRGQRQRDRRSA